MSHNVYVCVCFFFLSAYSYHMAYRTLDYTYYNNQHDIERLAAEILQAKHVNPNTVTLSNWKALVVTWKIIDNETPTKVIDNHIPLHKL